MSDIQKVGNVVADDSSNLSVNSNKGDEYDVDIWWVKDVKPGDAKQAEKTMKALLNAGLKPRLVAHALEKGHGYEIESLITCQRFSNINGKMGELAASETAVGVYEVVEKVSLESGEKTVEKMVQEEGLIKAKVVNDLEQSRNKSGEVLQKIEMTVVIKQEPSKQITDDVVKIED